MSGYVIRPATANDAAAINAHRRRIADEPNNFVTRSAGQYTRTVAEERARIESVLAADNMHIVVAEMDGMLVGNCGCWGSTDPAHYHRVELGIDVHVDYRGRGIGRALMDAMIEWARTNPVVHRVELDVFTHNVGAIQLYLTCGFVIEGRRQHAYFKYGEYVDAYLMALLVD